MPMIDMPIEQLREYRGINPRPSDFDAYWDRALAELDATDLQVSITESEFQMPNVECYDLYFTGVKGGRIYAKLLKPAHIAGRAPAILKFHGYGGSSGDWSAHMGLVASGFVVAALDTRGQGGKSEDKNPVSGITRAGHIIRGLDDPNPDNLFYRQSFLDTAALARIVMGLEYVDEGRVAAMGGSQGGALTLACAALVPEIVKLAPVHPFLSDYKRVWEMDLAKDAYVELREYFRDFDPCHEREEETFTKLGYIDMHHLAPRIRGEVFLTTGLMDNICPPSTVFAAYNHIVSKKNIRIYPDYGHESMPDLDDGNYLFMKDLL
ncbi:MAG: acetylxylan esterase [Ruminococcaceae bacterium]|nr:acetylxylan esterase [Oscillospiraceae bacterium]